MKRRGERGITLIEVAVVMAIVAIMGLFLAPAIGEWLDNYRIRQGARDITSTLQEAKMKAISNRLQYRLVFNVADETYQLWRNDPTSGWVTEGNANKAPRGVDIDNTEFTDDTVQFYPNGTPKDKDTGDPTSGNIYINNAEGKQYRVNVSAAGSIGMREGWS